MSREAAANRRREAWAWPPEAHEEPCPICLGPMADAVRALPCRHIFCRECIQRWTSNRSDCPLCRQYVGTLLRLGWRPSGRAPTRRPRGRLQRTRERRERRSPHRSRSAPPRRAQRSPSRPPRPLVRSSSWHGEPNQISRFEAPPREEHDGEWLRRVPRERQRGAGDHAGHPDGPRF